MDNHILRACGRELCTVCEAVCAVLVVGCKQDVRLLVLWRVSLRGLVDIFLLCGLKRLGSVTSGRLKDPFI